MSDSPTTARIATASASVSAEVQKPVVARVLPPCDPGYTRLLAREGFFSGVAHLIPVMGILSGGYLLISSVFKHFF